MPGWVHEPTPCGDKTCDADTDSHTLWLRTDDRFINTHSYTWTR